MKKANLSVSKLTLKGVHEQFTEWRRTKEWHDPIPEELWDAAVELTKEYSPAQVSKTLRLESSKFKERIHASRMSEIPQKVSSPFIELNFPASSSAAEYTVDTEDVNGRKMRICIKGQAIDVVGLTRAFWAREA